MRRLYGENHEERYACIARLICLGDSITELCMGDGCLFQHYLAKQTNEYIGLDINQHFIAHVKNKGIDARLFDVSVDPLPVADIVLMHASL